MKTSTYRWLVWMAAGVSVTVVVGCGPMYTEDRWYANDYYSHGPAQGYAQPQPVNTVAATPMVGADPQFNDLTPYGQWEMTGEYGRIWVPYANRTPGWRPYFYGEWQNTEWGWSWVSDEAWGAGPYHYGRWTWMNGRSWIWIPDYTWGPAWVTWSHGGGCVGWAPMGPGGATWGDIHAHSTYWTYVPTGHFGGEKVQHYVVAAADVPRIHQQTVIIDNGAQIRGNNGTVVTYNQGPPREQVQQWTARPVDTRPISQVPSMQPRRIPDNVAPPTGGSYGSATTPPPTRVNTPGNTPGNPTVPTRPGSTVPTTPNPSVVNPSVPDPRNPNAVTPTRPGVGTPATTPVTPPTRPGVGTPATEPPTRPGSGYTGPGPVTVPPQTTVPRPTPPPVDRGNYAPPPARYVPPTTTPPANNTVPTRPSSPSYTLPNAGSSSTYQPTRPATPSYSPPTYNTAPSYQPSRAAPSYSPPTYQPSRATAPAYSPPAQRFSPPPSYSPSPSRPATSSAPAPTRRR